MKKRWLLVLLALMMVFVAACGSSGGSGTSGSSSAGANSNSDNGSADNGSEATADEPQVNLRLAHVASEQSVYHVPAAEFVRLVEEKTNGTVTIDIYPGAQLGGDRDMLENVQNGSLDIGWISLAVFDAITPVFNGFQLPFLITDNEVAYEAFKSETAKKALATLEEFNIHGFAIVEGGLRQFASNRKPIRTPADMQGQNIRAPESQMLLDAFQTLGINPTPMPYPELYNALQTGVIDGAELPTYTWYSDGFQEVVDSIALTNSYPWPAMIVMSDRAYNMLSESQIEAIHEAASGELKTS